MPEKVYEAIFNGVIFGSFLGIIYFSYDGILKTACELVKLNEDTLEELSQCEEKLSQCKEKLSQCEEKLSQCKEAVN